MPRVKCPASACVFWEEGYCSAEEIELDPEDLSCMTFEELGDLELEEEEVEEEVWDEEEEEDEDLALEDLEEEDEDEEWL